MNDGAKYSSLAKTRMALSRAHTSAKTHQSPLIQSSLIQYQLKHIRIS